MSGSTASQDVLPSTPPCEKKSAPVREMKTSAGRAGNAIENSQSFFSRVVASWQSFLTVCVFHLYTSFGDETAGT